MPVEYWRQIEEEKRKQDAEKERASNEKLIQKQQQEKDNKRWLDEQAVRETEKQNRLTNIDDKLITIFKDIESTSPKIRTSRLHEVYKLLNPWPHEYDVYISLRWGDKFELTQYEKSIIEEYRKKYKDGAVPLFNRNKYPETILECSFDYIDASFFKKVEAYENNKNNIKISGKDYECGTTQDFYFDSNDFLKNSNIIIPCLAKLTGENHYPMVFSSLQRRYSYGSPPVYDDPQRNM